MTKDLQDLAWQYLPLKVKKEVKRLYKTRRNKRLNEVSSDFIYCLVYLFGKHNLTSDAEGEEMLMVPRSQIQRWYASTKKINDPSSKDYINGVLNTLETLLGSKSLSNEDPNPAEDLNIDNPFEKRTPLSPEVEEIIDKMTTEIVETLTRPIKEYFEKFDKKPTEPKYHIGQKVKFKDKDFGVEIMAIEKWDDCDEYKYKLAGWKHSYRESDLEPYTEPEEESRNLSQETANCDKEFDKILKDSFSKERRLNIAAMAMQGILSNADKMKQYGEIAMRESESLTQLVARNAMRYADALIAEAEKGDTK